MSVEPDQLFSAVVQGYVAQGMISLGKMANPMTGETGRDLKQAKAMIDILEVLEKKTEGNRTEEESNLFKQGLSALRLNWVDEVSKGSDEEPGIDPGTSEGSPD